MDRRESLNMKRTHRYKYTPSLSLNTRYTRLATCTSHPFAPVPHLNALSNVFGLYSSIIPHEPPTGYVPLITLPLRIFQALWSLSRRDIADIDSTCDNILIKTFVN